VVAVVAYTDGGKSYSTCTGEVIAGDVVLTASHCIDPRALGFVPEGIQIMTSQDILQATNAQVFPARTAVPHPAYNPQTGANDIAVVLLQGAIDIAPLPYNRTALEGLALDGKSGRAIGYGTTKDGDSSTAGKKNQATLKLSKINAFDFTASALPATQCHGDSGGPVLAMVDGKEQIIGIGWITVRNDGLCSEGVRDTRVDKYLAFIDPFVKASGGAGQAPPAPAPAPKGGGNPGTDICCFNGQFYDCPTSAACLGGFDINACLDACTTAACQIACTQKLAGKTPTNQCTRAPQKDQTCNGG
jgi:secreted trypsin-like serine protease